MFDQPIAEAVKTLFNYGILGIVAAALGYLYHRSQAEIRTLNAVILEMTRATTSVIEKNTAALQNAASAQERATDAQRELASAMRQLPPRAGGS